MFFVGNTRFSLFQPKSTAWHASKNVEDLEAYKAYLYSDVRMQPRVEVFFGRSLPQIDKAAAAHDLTHVISFSAEMPERWRDKITEAANRYPWILLDEHHDGVGVHNINRVATEMISAGGATTGVYGTYRLDDDDLLPIDYFDRVGAYMSEANVGMYVSLGKGITALYQDGAFSSFRELLHPKIAIGLLSICRVEPDGSWTVPPRYESHLRADEAAPVILDCRQPGFLWTRSIQQDSVYRGGGDRISAELDKHHPATADDVQRYFPSAL